MVVRARCNSPQYDNLRICNRLLGFGIDYLPVDRCCRIMFNGADYTRQRKLNHRSEQR